MMQSLLLSLFYSFISVPCPNMFIQLNPIQVTLDTATCLWFNNFIQNVIGERVSGVISRQHSFFLR